MEQHTGARRRTWTSWIARSIVGALVATATVAIVDESRTPPAAAADPVIPGFEPWRQIVQSNALGIAAPPAAIQAWRSLESEATSMVAAIHQVPNDGRVVVSAREESVAMMYARLVTTIEAAAAGEPIEPYEQAWITEINRVLAKKRIAEADAALGQYATWESDPCNYDVPAGFGFDPYDVYCVGFGGLFIPSPPSSEQFIEYGAASFHSQQLGAADLKAEWLQTAQMLTLIGTIGGGALLAGLTAALVSSSPALATLIVKVIAPFAIRVGEKIGQAFINMTGALLSAGVIAVIAIAAAVTAVGAWREFENNQVLSRLQYYRNQAGNVDVVTMAQPTGTNPVGLDPDELLEIYTAMFTLTQPSYAAERLAASTPRPHDPTQDPFWKLPDGTITALLDTVDWSGRPQRTYLADGWMATSVDGGPYEWGLDLKMSTDGFQYTVTRAGRQFLVDMEPNAALGTIRAVTWTTTAGRTGATIFGNSAPSIVVSVPPDLVAGTDFVLRAEATDQDENDEVAVRWELEREPGPGLSGCFDILNLTNPNSCGIDHFTGNEVTRRYMKPGTWNGRVIATDLRGVTTSQDFVMSVSNVVPTLTIDPTTPTPEGALVRIEGSSTDSGYDSLALVVDWGDGTPTTTGRYPCSSVRTDGTCASIDLGAAPNPANWFFTHVYASPPSNGEAYTITVTASDGRATTTESILQQVTPLPLEVTSVTASAVEEGGTSSVQGWIHSPAGPVFDVELSFGDGTSRTLDGSCSGEPDCAVSQTPTNGLGGTFICATPCHSYFFRTEHTFTDDPPGDIDQYEVTATAVRPGIASHELSTFVSVSNVPPALESLTMPDFARIGDEVYLSGLVDDPGSDWHELEIDWGRGDAETALVGRSTFQVPHSYTDVSGPEPFVVTVQAVDDDGGRSEVVERTIDVRPQLNQAPSATAFALSVDEDAQVVVPFTAAVGDDIVSPDQLVIDVVEPPEHGTLTEIGGVWTYRPDPDFESTDRFTYRSVDLGSPTGCAPVSDYCYAAERSEVVAVDVTVTPVPDAPTVVVTGTSSLDEGQEATYSVSITDPDLGDGFLIEVSCGMSGVLATGLDMNTDRSGTFDCRFPDGTATATIEAHATDAWGLSGVGSAPVTIANVAPVPSIAGGTSTRTILPNETVDVVGTVVDPGDDVVTSQISWGDGTREDATTPTGFVGSHVFVTPGTYPVVVTASDDEDSTTMSLTVVVAEKGRALAVLADRLAQVDSSGWSTPDKDALARAGDRLRSVIDPRTGVDLVDTDPRQAMDILLGAMSQLDRLPAGAVDRFEADIIRIARSIVVDQMGAARERTGCVSLAAPKCSKRSATAIRSAQALAETGDTQTAAQRWLDATESYRTAVIIALAA